MPVKAHKESNPAVQEIADLLAARFNAVEPKIHGELQAAYRDYAKRNHKALLEASKDPANTGHIGGSRGDRWMGWYQNTKFQREKAMKEWRAKWPGGSVPNRAYKEMPPNDVGTWEDLRAWSGFMKLDYEHADEQAKLAFESARNAFIHKNVGKVRNVLEARTEIRKAVVQFSFDRARNIFSGSIEVQLPDGSFEAELGLKYVIRRIPQVTPYFQYPLNFTTATVAGKTKARPSEEELRILLGGKPPLSFAEQLEAKGCCPNSGKEIKYSPETAWIQNRMSPYMTCPDCGQTVSVRRFKWRMHLKKAK
jgi:hypothetical protein